MNWRNTLILALIALAGFAYFRFFEMKRPSTEEAKRQAQNVVNFDRNKIDAINLVSIEIDHVLRLPLCLLSARPLHFEKPEISEASEGNERQDEGIPPVHTRPAVATTPWFRLPRELTV